MIVKQCVPLLPAVALTVALLVHDCRAADATGDLAAVPDAARVFCKEIVKEHIKARVEKLDKLG